MILNSDNHHKYSTKFVSAWQLQDNPRMAVTSGWTADYANYPARRGAIVTQRRMGATLRCQAFGSDCDRLSGERLSPIWRRGLPLKSIDLPGETFRLICGALAAAAPINERRTRQVEVSPSQSSESETRGVSDSPVRGFPCHYLASPLTPLLFACDEAETRTRIRKGPFASRKVYRIVRHEPEDSC